MEDFEQFFIKNKNELDKCFVCSNSSKQGYPSIQKENKFFNIESVFRRIEVKDIREKTLAQITKEKNN